MRIVTPRLVLREYTSENWREACACQRDPHCLRFYPWTGRTDADVQNLVQRFLDQQEDQPRRMFRLAVTLADDGRLIAGCGLRCSARNEREGDIGFELAPAHSGQGYATEAARAMVDFGLREMELHRVSSWCVADNTPSVRVLERIGLRLEGRLRDPEYFKGRWWDKSTYGLPSDEWSSVDR